MTVTDAESMEEMISEWGSIGRSAGINTERRDEIDTSRQSYRSSGSVRAGKVDLAFTGPAEYVAINKLTNGEAMIGIARPDYYCGIVVKTADGYTKGILI